ncbi:hypothetical protein [Nitratireductor sp. ZSWI3]|uniref:hypothetical protein n=1 Tax=Nitratireductor sp. ZSWI3 TaxID=2966359 RepID=UPI0021504382|nr:hypothetical protein [Nitratireductor sp. ZSWI3]MCR4266265.1 hypothetical protein [Nitratireductor sp. ZSWI3]
MGDRLSAALWRALPSPSHAVFGALLWGALMGANAFLFLWLADWRPVSQLAGLAGIFALGGAIGFPAGHTACRLLSRHERTETRFAAAFLAFATATLGATAMVYALQYRAYYAQWHGPLFSLRWILEFVFTTAGALYQFAVLGLRIYFPWGFAALFALSLYYAAKPR